ncbi:MAG: glycerophosphodiester phosphodiesterase family protein [Candidatus Solibacter usitatus]|nr:glycerophosphodiester phosphodiesterase family protein [Candidatus Solibacter usitatus]
MNRRPIRVIAHRGAHEAHPQNSLAAYNAAIALGCDFIEVDLRTAPDGRLLIKHDPLIKHDDYDRLPSFDDVLDTAKGRIRIYLDVKQAMPASIVAVVEKHRMTDSILTYASQALLRELVQLRPGWPCMPEASTPEVLRDNLRTLKPPAVAFSDWNFKPEQIALAQAAGCEIFLDRQGKTDFPEFWQAAIDMGATGIQTDRPTALLAFLRAAQLHA